MEGYNQENCRQYIIVMRSHINIIMVIIKVMVMKKKYNGNDANYGGDGGVSNDIK